jgi:hypothetical protein
VRQFFSLRYWAAIGGVLGLCFLALVISKRADDPANSFDVLNDSRGVAHRIDLVEPVFSIEAAPGFKMGPTGEANGELRMYLDAERVMVVQPGTPGDIRCAELAELAKCVVVADLLGEAVVWFSLLPSEPRASITLPPVASIGQDGWALLDNGWEVRHAEKIERNCDEETSNLGEFIRKFGEQSTSTFDFGDQQIVRVNCLQE